MTAAPKITDPCADEDRPNDRADRWLATAGLRPTRQRRVLAALLVGDGRHRHVTAERLFDAAHAAGAAVSLATVYNTLKSFTEAGLLTEIAVDGARSYFDTRTEDHPHFFWEEEGRLTDAPVDSVQFSRLPDAPKDMQVAKIDVVIRLRRR
ncbi:transcriptional repressor [Pikeienuella piscinae]|uniref:Ferric uptake regulation protein n=1 Tax=Pikeienuella piscinae TaxID=2748098 RepID=A0A7L5C2H1_9RHOB|nr:Fur family transcriptional regulator [Pikeienuella piscinae]QIE56394.1 transcriptional repressor [Pikeienuella piscinae]